jgi:hypothetical protein
VHELRNKDLADFSPRHLHADLPLSTRRTGSATPQPVHCPPLLDTWKKLEATAWLPSRRYPKHGRLRRAIRRAWLTRNAPTTFHSWTANVLRPFTLAGGGLRKTRWLRYGDQPHRRSATGTYRRTQARCELQPQPWLDLAACRGGRTHGPVLSDNFHGVIPSRDAAVDRANCGGPQRPCCQRVV